MTEAESEEKETLLILLTPISSSFRLCFRFRFSLDRNAPSASHSDSVSDSFASVNQPLTFKEKLVRFQFLIICSREHDVAVLASYNQVIVKLNEVQFGKLAQISGPPKIIDSS